MWTLIVKEIKDFAAQPFGLVAVGVLLLLTYLFLWVFGDSSYISYGLAEPDLFFQFMAYLMLFVVPAFAVQYLTEDISNRTIELLRSMSISWQKIISAKYLAAMVVVGFLLLLSYGHLYVLRSVSVQGDFGAGTSVVVSLLGLLALGGVFVGLSFWISSMINQTVPAYIVSVAVCFIMYQGIGLVANMGWLHSGQGYWLESLGLDYHIDLLSRGILRLSSILYMLSWIIWSVMATQWTLADKDL